MGNNGDGHQVDVDIFEVDWEVPLRRSIGSVLDIYVWPDGDGDGEIGLSGPLGVAIEFGSLAEFERSVGLMTAALATARQMLRETVDDRE